MDRRNLQGWGLLMLLIAGFIWVPDLLPGRGPDHRSIERTSARLGWHPAEDTDDLARDVFARVNDERRTRGLPPVVWDEGLAALARRWSEHMIERGYEHSPDSFRRLPGYVGSGENIAMGQTDTTQLHVGWMRSDGHRENILRPEYGALGVGIVCRSDGQMWATQIFGIAEGTRPSGARGDTGVEPITRTDAGLRCPHRGVFGRGP